MHSFSLVIEGRNYTVDAHEEGREQKRSSAMLWHPQPATSFSPRLPHSAFLGQHLPTETHQLYLLPAYFGISYLSCRVRMLPNNPSQDKFLLAPLNKLHYSSSSVSGGRSDNPPWKCSCWQMCAWLSRITAAIRKTKLYPLVATIQWWSSGLLLYGTWSWTGHDVPAVIPCPCTSNLCSLLMWTFFFFFAGV